jgi:hypothetical protein
MTLRTNGRIDADPPPDLRQFTLDFFASFGAVVTKLDRRKLGALRVELPETLAAHFGQETLTLCFQHVDLGSGQELVAYGSRIFDRMMSFLDQGSAMTVQKLPARFKAGEELLQAVRPVNAAVAGLKIQETYRPLFAFTWHITYRADDKREELYTVVVDDEGVRVPLRGESQVGDGGFDWPGALADVGEAEAKGEGEDGEEGKLPPMTHLVRHGEAARKYAIYHADLRCVAHEAEILPRLHKVLSRLISYYQQQIDEVYDAHDPEFQQRRTLEADLQRKIDEEIENHRLRVTIALSSYAVLEIPAAVAELTLQSGTHSLPVIVERNLYDGSLQRPPCHACGEPAHEVAIDHHGHLTCTACRHTCASCRGIFCAECGVHLCPVCQQENCAQCSVFCWACGGHACIDHVARCPVCDDAVCLACQQTCAACGTRQCTSHLRRDAVADARDQVELICRECAVRCPGCQQFSAHVDTCAASGQRFCLNCIVRCDTCGKTVGPGFYHADPATGARVCSDCLLRCPACDAIVAEESACKTCGTPCCATCGTQCAACGELFCTQHLTRMACGHAYCADHVTACAIGDEALCPACTQPCAICDRPHCNAHTATCDRCRLAYCSECVGDGGFCTSCEQMDVLGVDVDLTQEPCIDDPAVAEVATFYRWRRIANRRYLIYLGKGIFMSAAMVTVEKTPTGGRVLDVREFDLDDLLRANFWRK